MALLALEAVQTSGVLVTVASTAAGVTAVTLADIAPAQAGVITMTGSNATGSTFTGTTSTASYTIFDLVDGGTSTTKAVTFTAKNDTNITRVMSGSTFSTGSPGTLSGTALSVSIGKGAVGSGAVNYSYLAASTASMSATRVYAFPGGINRSAH